MGYKRNAPTSTTSVAKRSRSTFTRRTPARRGTKPVKVSFGKQPIPKQLYSRLKYAEQVTFTLNTSGLGSYIFSANGLYDPNITGTGHQPMYFDQLMTLYNHYTVTGSKIKVTPLNSAALPTIWSLFKDDDAAILTTIPATAVERPDSVTTTEYLTVQPGRPMWQTFDARATFGGDPLATDSLQGNVGANPTEQTYFAIYCNGGINAALQGVDALVEIWYDVNFDELTSIASS